MKDEPAAHPQEKGRRREQDEPKKSRNSTIRRKRTSRCRLQAKCSGQYQRGRRSDHRHERRSRGLKLAQSLIRSMTSTKQVDQIEVIPLKNAQAVDAAKILDETFNGVKQGNQPPMMPNFGGGGFPAAAEASVVAVAAGSTRSLASSRPRAPACPRARRRAGFAWLPIPPRISSLSPRPAPWTGCRSGS